MGGTQAQWRNATIPNWHHLQTKTTQSNVPAALSRRLDIFPLDAAERVIVITPDPNQPKEQAVRQFWSPRNEDCVLFDMIFDNGTKYEEYGELDPQTRRPVTSFADAVSVQPWDLVPPSSFATASRSHVTMEAGDFEDAAQVLADGDRRYGHGDEGDDQNSEDESDDER